MHRRILSCPRTGRPCPRHTKVGVMLILGRSGGDSGVTSSSCFHHSTDPPVVKEEAKKVAPKPPEVPPPARPKLQNEVNYASITAGAVVLDHSEAFVGSSSLLDDNKDKYARSPCDQPKWVVINLSEDVSGSMQVEVGCCEAFGLRGAGVCGLCVS